jgi:Polyphosphate kinase 2 (PPK2)
VTERLLDDGGNLSGVMTSPRLQARVLEQRTDGVTDEVGRRDAPRHQEGDEEVLVVRVHPENLVRQRFPAETREHHIWKRRYESINDWERHLSDNGFRIVKIFLNLSREEQRVRFLRRIDLPEHHWKFSFHDVEERRSWDAYQEAFSEMLSHTSTGWAPWHVIPADRKWFARIGAAAVIAHALIDIDPQYPTLGDDALRDLQAAKAQLESEAPDDAAPDPFEDQETRTPVGTLAQKQG